VQGNAQHDTADVGRLKIMPSLQKFAAYEQNFVQVPEISRNIKLFFFVSGIKQVRADQRIIPNFPKKLRRFSINYCVIICKNILLIEVSSFVRNVTE
jgi:hypothetical protein